MNGVDPGMLTSIEKVYGSNRNVCAPVVLMVVLGREPVSSSTIYSSSNELASI
jgi:hypothetical protein